MTCSACTAAVENCLTQLPGVTKAAVSLLQQIVRIEYYPSQVSQVKVRAPIDVLLCGQD